MANIRGRGLFNAKYKTVALYQYYKKENPESKLIRSKHNTILSEINEAIFKEIIDNNFELIMPYNLGKKKVKKVKIMLRLNDEGELDTSNLMVDWAKTNQLWEKDPSCKVNKTFIYLTNNHTKGFKFGFHWSKKVSVKRRKVNNLNIMAFKATKTTRQYLRDRLKNPFVNHDYFQYTTKFKQD